MAEMVQEKSTGQKFAEEQLLRHGWEKGKIRTDVRTRAGGFIHHKPCVCYCVTRFLNCRKDINNSPA